MKSRTRGDKGTTLLQLAHVLCIDPDKMVVFSDDYNHLPMFAAAVKAVAMANSPEEVKREADLIIPDNSEKELISGLTMMFDVSR